MLKAVKELLQSRLSNIGNLHDLAKQLLKTELTELKGFGKELKYLFESEYTYDLTNNIFIK